MQSNTKYAALSVVLEGCVYPWVKPNENANTIEQNNIADSILATKAGNFLPDAKNNIQGLSDVGPTWWDQELVDPASFDFRPKARSKSAASSVGAYAAGMSDEVYHSMIPGCTHPLCNTTAPSPSPTPPAPPAPPTPPAPPAPPEPPKSCVDIMAKLGCIRGGGTQCKQCIKAGRHRIPSGTCWSSPCPDTKCFFNFQKQWCTTNPMPTHN